MNENIPLHKKGTFCVKPFLQSAITSNGMYRVCCECVFGKKMDQSITLENLLGQTAKHIMLITVQYKRLGMLLY